MIGSGFPYSEFLPKEGHARGVQIDIAPDMLSLRYPMEVNLVGEAAETLRALLPLLKQKDDGTWRESIAGNVKAWWKTLEERAMASANPVNPQRVAGNCRRGCPMASSSPATRARAQIGTRAI